jgi:hypothetical protein
MAAKDVAEKVRWKKLEIKVIMSASRCRRRGGTEI